METWIIQNADWIKPVSFGITVLCVYYWGFRIIQLLSDIRKELREKNAGTKKQVLNG